MLASVAALALMPVAYGFNPEFSHTYSVRIGFDGFLPVLGGSEGKVQVDMGLDVRGLAAEGGALRASSDISSFKLQFNGTEFPLDLQSVKTYFPKTTISLTPEGKVLKTDAPDIKLPVRLPGLDVKRFPDVTFVPVEFPAEGVEAGKSWSYKKSFGDSEVSYTVTPSQITDETLTLGVEISQSYTSFEDSSFAVVASAADAESSVSTKLDGKGTVVFDRKLGVIRSEDIQAVANSDVTNLKDKTVTKRKLATSVTVAFDKIQGGAEPSSGSGGGALQFLAHQAQKAVPIQRAIVAAQLMHPRGGSGGSAAPLFISAVNQIHVPSKTAVRRQVEHLSVLARDAAGRVPELVDVNAVEHLRSLVGGFASVARQHWGPNYERLHRLGNQVVQNLVANYASAMQAGWQRR